MKPTLTREMLFLDGNVVPMKSSVLDSLTPGVMTGRGVFETMRAYKGKIFAAQEHLLRLRIGLKQLGIAAPYSTKRLIELLKITLRSNKLSNARIRLTVWKEGSRLRTAIVALPYKPYPASIFQKGFSVAVSQVICDRELKDACLKSIDYGAFLNAYASAVRRGFDEAIVVNRRGEVAEGSRSNIFWMKNGKLLTPSLDCGCLKGITRQKILDLAKGLKITVHQVRVKPQELFRAEEIFLTNSLMEIMPVTMLEGSRVGSGKPGLTTRTILKKYRSLVNKTVN